MGSETSVELARQEADIPTGPARELGMSEETPFEEERAWRSMALLVFHRTRGMKSTPWGVSGLEAARQASSTPRRLDFWWTGREASREAQRT